MPNIPSSAHFQALMYHQVRKYLLRLRMDEATAKYWRPQFLFMVNNPRYSLDAMLFVNEVKKVCIAHAVNAPVEGRFKIERSSVSAHCIFVDRCTEMCCT